MSSRRRSRAALEQRRSPVVDRRPLDHRSFSHRRPPGSGEHRAEGRAAVPHLGLDEPVEPAAAIPSAAAARRARNASAASSSSAGCCVDERVAALRLLTDESRLAPDLAAPGVDVGHDARRDRELVDAELRVRRGIGLRHVGSIRSSGRRRGAGPAGRARPGRWCRGPARARCSKRERGLAADEPRAVGRGDRRGSARWRAIIRSASRRSFAPIQSASKSSSRQRPSSAASSAASSASPPSSRMRCSIVPIAPASSGSPPATRSTNQSSGELLELLELRRRDPHRRGRGRARAGRRWTGAASPCQCSGAAPGTPVAGEPGERGGRLLRAAGRAGDGDAAERADERAQRVRRGVATTARAGAVGEAEQHARRLVVVRDRREHEHVPRAGRGERERAAARRRARRGARRPGRRARRRRSSTATRSPTPSREPRGSRFGQTPSCSPASTTVSNSRPATPTGVVTSTPSRDAAGREGVVGHLGAELGGDEDGWPGRSGARSAARAAAVKSATTPSRSRFGLGRADAAAPSARSRQLGARPLRSQTSQSSSSAEPPAAAASRTACSVCAKPGRAARERRARSWRAGRARRARRRAARRRCGCRRPRAPRRAARAAGAGARAGPGRRTGRRAASTADSGVSGAMPSAAATTSSRARGGALRRDRQPGRRGDGRHPGGLEGAGERLRLGAGADHDGLVGEGHAVLEVPRRAAGARSRARARRRCPPRRP